MFVRFTHETACSLKLLVSSKSRLRRVQSEPQGWWYSKGKDVGGWQTGLLHRSKRAHWVRSSYWEPILLSWYRTMLSVLLYKWCGLKHNLKICLCLQWLNNRYLRQEPLRSTRKARLYRDGLKDRPWPKVSRLFLFFSPLPWAIARTNELWFTVTPENITIKGGNSDL